MKVIAFTDASYDINTGSGGVGVYFQNMGDDDASVSIPVTGMLDNNHGQLFAISVVMASISKSIPPEGLISVGLTIYVDSDHAFELIQGRRKVKEGRDDEAVTLKNVLLLMESFQSVDLVCLKAHRGFSPLGMANEHCDRLAKKAMRGLRDNKIKAISIDDFFEKSKIKAA